MTSSKFVLFLFAIGFSYVSYAKAAINKSPIKVAYFSVEGAEHFETKVKPFFKDQASSCKSCEIVNMTPYTKEGKADLTALNEAIANLPSETSFIFFDFNLKNNDSTKELVETLNKKSSEGVMVVASAGVPTGKEASAPLSRTVLGMVQDAIIIGEISERDRLTPQGFYGPEMFTAVRPPKDKMGQGVGPLLFASQLAENWQRRESQEWLEYFKNKKLKSRKIWVDMNDLF